MTNIEDVAAWQLCCGCGACAYMDPDEIVMIDTLAYGRRPRLRNRNIDVRANEEALTVCPGIALRRPGTARPGIIQDLMPAWGPVLGVWEGYAEDRQIRYEGASGGTATALAFYGMEQSGMYGTLHIRAREDIPYLNRTVLSQTKEDLLAGAGSRYAPASPCDGLDMIEEAPAPCVFIGKPCDVAAVRKVVELRPRLKDKIGLTIAFFCAGTPSTVGTLAMLRHMGIEDPGSLISLRYRGRGWPGEVTATYRDNGAIVSRTLTYEQSWGTILAKQRQWRCYICPDHVGEFADIAVADAWHQSIRDHQPGRSVIIARTARGKQFLQQAISAGYLKAEPVSPEVLPACRPGQAPYLGQLWARLQTLKALQVPTPDYKGFALFELWKAELSVREKGRSILSTVKRILFKRLWWPLGVPPLVTAKKSEGGD